MRREPQGGIERRHRVETPIEPEHEFVEISLQMMMTYSVMRPKQPCLEVREGDVDHRRVSFGSFGVAIKHQGFVRATQFRQIVVSLPAIGAHNGPFRDILPHEFREFLGPPAWHDAQPQSASVNHSPVLLAFGDRRPGAYLDGSNAKISAFRAVKAIWPSQMLQVSCAGFVVGKNPLKLGKRCGEAAGVHSVKLAPTHQFGKQPDRQSSTFRPNAIPYRRRPQRFSALRKAKRFPRNG